MSTHNVYKSMEYCEGDLVELIDKGWFDYDGYNPAETAKALEKIEPDPSTLSNDIKVCAYFVMNRGNKPSKAMLKMDKHGKDLLSGLIVKYKIIQTAPKTKSDLTMSRIAGISPLFCAQICEMESTRMIGMKPKNLPKSLTFPSAPALIPKEREDLYQEWLQWALSFNQTISGGKASEKVDFFGRIIQDSGYVKEHEKNVMLERLRII